MRMRWWNTNRAAWIVGLAMIFFSSYFLSPRVGTGLAITALSMTLILGSFWGVFHPRRVMALRTAAFRDALLATVVLFLLIRGALVSSQGEAAGGSLMTLLGPLVIPLISSASSILLFPLVLWLSLTLIAVAGMLSPHSESWERSMLPLFWPTLTLGVVLDLLLLGTRLWPPGFASLISPFCAFSLVRDIHRRGLDADAISQRLTQILHRKCTRQRGWGLRDLRGIVLGGAAAAVVLGFAVSRLRLFLVPYQGAAYAQAVQFGSHLAAINTPIRDDENTEISLLDGVKFSLPGSARTRTELQELVLITYDEETLRRALQSDISEAQLQAELVKRLTPWKPAAIVLPIPPEREEDMPHIASPTQPVFPTTLSERNIKGFPMLRQALLASKRVILARSAREAHTDAIKSLEAAAKGIGSSDIGVADAPEIPTITLRGSPPSVPLLLLSKKLDMKRYPEGVALLDYRVDLREVRAPVRISQVQTDQPHYDTVTKTWQPPQTFFANKLVFVEAMAPRQHLTPVGLRSEMEIMAQATATLRRGVAFQTMPFWIMALLTLGLSLLIGHLSVGRAPLESLWRITPLLLLVGVFCFGMTALGNLRTDPVLPLLGGSLAFFIVTQFTFAVERDERERNRNILRRFLPPQAIEQMLDDPETKLGLGGKRRPIVVIFVDVRGFSGFAEKRTPEEVVATMNRYLTAMTDALNSYGGILDKYTGDGLMALFPVEKKSEGKDVLCAVQAAQAMATAAHEVAQTMRAEGGDELGIGMGLHYGEAVVGLVGHPTRQINYTALGHTVVVAARLQTLASGGEIILSQAVYQALPPGSISGEAGESVQVKGVSEPVPIYRLTLPR